MQPVSKCIPNDLSLDTTVALRVCAQGYTYANHFMYSNKKCVKYNAKFSTNRTSDLQYLNLIKKRAACSMDFVDTLK